MKKLLIIMLFSIMFSAAEETVTTYVMKNDTVITGQKVFEDSINIILRTGNGPVQIEKSGIDRILKKENQPGTFLKAGVGYYNQYRSPEYFAGVMLGDNVEACAAIGRQPGPIYTRYGLRYFYQKHTEINVKGTGGFLGLYYTNYSVEALYPSTEKQGFASAIISTGYQAKAGILLIGFEVGYVFNDNPAKLTISYPSYMNNDFKDGTILILSLGTSI